MSSQYAWHACPHVRGRSSLPSGDTQSKEVTMTAKSSKPRATQRSQRRAGTAASKKAAPRRTAQRINAEPADTSGAPTSSTVPAANQADVLTAGIGSDGEDRVIVRPSAAEVLRATAPPVPPEEAADEPGVSSAEAGPLRDLLASRERDRALLGARRRARFRRILRAAAVIVLVCATFALTISVSVFTTVRYLKSHDSAAGFESRVAALELQMADVSTRKPATDDKVTDDLTNLNRWVAELNEKITALVNKEIIDSEARGQITSLRDMVRQLEERLSKAAESSREPVAAPTSLPVPASRPAVSPRPAASTPPATKCVPISLPGGGVIPCNK